MAVELLWEQGLSMQTIEVDVAAAASAVCSTNQANKHICRAIDEPAAGVD
jgi:hypothetical protein